MSDDKYLLFNELKKLSRIEAHKYYLKLENHGRATNTLAEVVRMLVLNDLYYLLVCVCNRNDMINDFAYAKKSPLIHLQPHMTITNEPGYYEEGQFGIRIENIMVVDKVLNNNDFLCFRPLTLVPYCSRLIQKDLLEKAHQTTVSSYYT